MAAMRTQPIKSPTPRQGRLLASHLVAVLAQLQATATSARQVCLACGCLCRPDEQCPGCRAERGAVSWVDAANVAMVLAFGAVAAGVLFGWFG